MRLSRADYRALAGFRYQLRRFLHFSEAAARVAGIEPQQHQLLLAIKGLEPTLRPVVAVLAERLQLRHNSTVELLDRCQSRGLVERVTHATADSREVLLRLTVQGEQVLAALSAEHHRELADLGPRLISALSHFLGPRNIGKATPRAGSTRRAKASRISSLTTRRADSARVPARAASRRVTSSSPRTKGTHAKPRR